jgi:hypothetical protein
MLNTAQPEYGWVQHSGAMPQYEGMVATGGLEPPTPAL